MQILRCSPTPLLFLVFLSLVSGPIVSNSQAGSSFDWKGGQGRWEDAVMWGGTVPSGTAEARINGTRERSGDVTITSADALVHHLSIADDSGSAGVLILDGPSLTVPGTIDVGKYDGSDGRFVIKSGNVFAGTIFVSGGGGPGMRGRGTVEIHDGTLVTKDIELGVSAGCHSALNIIGSKCSGIAVEDGLHIGVYNYLSLEKQPPPSTTELIFNLDAEGVTPIFVWGKTEGRVNFPVPDSKGNGLGTCRLEVNLLAPPPSGDILLIGCANACHGTFVNLAEGTPVRAQFGGREYQWKLTYRGGSAAHDIMLTDARVAAADGKMIPHVTGHPARVFRFEQAFVESAYRVFYRQSDALASPIENGTLAFPGAEGYGAYTHGGRGGKVLLVTNLKDFGPGSLRHAIETKGPRTVIFRVGGIIETKGLEIREPYITIAGQTAPGDGICIKRVESAGSAVAITATHDVVLRFLRIRAGNNTGETRGESLRAIDSDNFIIDHCSCSWGNPETLSVSGASDCYTVQWCIISEGNAQQQHAFASIAGGNRSTWHHNLFAHMLSRIPRWGDITVQCDFRNNVVYDWGFYSGYGDLRSLNFVNNYFRKGASTTQKPPLFILDPKAILSASLYVNGNVMDGKPDVSRDNWKGVQAERGLESQVPFAAPPVQTQSAQAALDEVLNKSGATLPKPDSVDDRAVSDTRNRTGKIIMSEKDVGGWPVYASGEPPIATARDGIPDEWKKAHGLSVTDLSIARALNSDGYTELEEYLNSLVPKVAPAP